MTDSFVKFALVMLLVMLFGTAVLVGPLIYLLVAYQYGFLGTILGLPLLIPFFMFILM